MLIRGLHAGLTLDCLDVLSVVLVVVVLSSGRRSGQAVLEHADIGYRLSNTQADRSQLVFRRLPEFTRTAPRRQKLDLFMRLFQIPLQSCYFILLFHNRSHFWIDIDHRSVRNGGCSGRIL